MPQLAVRGPFAEPDLGDQARLDPVHARPWQSCPVVERRADPLQLRQRRMQLPQHGVAEAGSDLAGVGQLAVGIVVAEQQRTEALPRALWVGVAADDELLGVLALELQPVSRPAALVRRGGALGDKTFPAIAA